jgi:hypothetical protein
MSNTVDSYYTTISGGHSNTASGGWWNTIGGGDVNVITGTVNRGTVSGGGWNVITGTADAATVGGGLYNEASGNTATIAGGSNNTAVAQYATVGGGYLNRAEDYQSTVSGGADNSARYRATVSGGFHNEASGPYAAVGGGSQHVASGDSATIPGGYDNEAAGTYAFAAGRQAKALHEGSFIWADSNPFDFASLADNSFKVRATGGVRFVVGIDGSGNTTWSCLLNDGSAWSCSSDRSLKENFELVDGLEVLVRLSQVPIQTWNAKGTDPGIRHMGPTAQDFYAAFGLGEDDKHISTVDADGVALAAIQGLYKVSRDQATQIKDLKAENATQQAQIDSLEARLVALEAGAGNNASPARLPAGWLLLGGLGVVAMVVLQRQRQGDER